MHPQLDIMKTQLRFSDVVIITLCCYSADVIIDLNLFFFQSALCQCFSSDAVGMKTFFGCAVHLLELWKCFVYTGRSLYILPPFSCLYECTVQSTISVCNEIAFTNMVTFLV